MLNAARAQGFIVLAQAVITGLTVAAAIAFAAPAVRAQSFVPVRDWDVYVDLPTRFAYVKTPLGWKYIRQLDEAQMAQAVARAPVSGTVMGLVANTVGGVSPRGEKLMDIIPDKRALEIEARIALNDANDLRVGQKADVRIGGMRGRDLPLLHGKVSRVSADSVTDEKTGLSYFTSTVSIPEAEMKTLTRVAGTGDSIRPGTPVEVIVPLQRRTALEYWLSPLLHRFSPAMAER